ncbi:MAG TPA: methyltransferase, partial [bacterium]|nr:methyltransferase [bacterium]
RALEELPVLPRHWVKPLPACADGLASLLAPPVGEPLALRAHLLSGQKTGLFLDQGLNLALAAHLVLRRLASRPAAALRVLDLFCYVGQWGARLAQVAARAGSQAQVLAVDASGPALDLAAANIAACGGQVRILRQDLLAGMEGLEPAAFDVVVCDPPALVQRRKDLPKAVRAYQKLAREALRRVAPQGLLVMCSCSGLLPEEEFGAMLQRAQAQAQRPVQWVLRGGQGPDHPVLAEFPEGRYLKCWMGVVS